MDPGPASDAPTELRTFLVADIRGYTRFTDQRGDEAAGRLAGKFAQLAREAAEAHGGRVLELRGDEALAVFGSARQALRAGIDLQSRCRTATETDPSLPLAVGIGLDAGEAVAVEGGFRGAALNLAARLCAAAAPGEVLAGEGLVYLARKTEGLVFRERESMELKGFAEPVRVFRVVPEGSEELPAPTGPVQLPATRPLRPPVPYRAQTPAQQADLLNLRASFTGLGDAIREQVRQELTRDLTRDLARASDEVRISMARERNAGRPPAVSSRPVSEPRPGRRVPPTLREVVTALVILVFLIVIVILAAHFL